jgi:hypothetical protein
MAEAQGRLGATVAELWLHRKNSGERGLGGQEGLGANRGVFHVAGERVMEVGGRWRSSLVTRAKQERGRGGLAKGASERGEVGEQGAGFKSDAGARTWPENARSWACPRRGIMGGRLRMTNRWARRDREIERAGAGKRNDADRSTA